MAGDRRSAAHAFEVHVHLGLRRLAVGEDTGAAGAAGEEEHRKDHAAIAALSRRGRQIVAVHSGHHVQLEEPQLVVSAIQEVVTAASP
jgi:hypothetical protein